MSVYTVDDEYILPNRDRRYVPITDKHTAVQNYHPYEIMSNMDIDKLNIDIARCAINILSGMYVYMYVFCIYA